MSEPAPKQEEKKYTILFVDDEPNILRALKRALFKMNINMLLADSGKKALELLESNTVHVVVSDMKMPHMSGAELLEQVAKLYPETFRVVLTGFADIDSTIKAVNQGKIHRYLQKPWDNQELMNTLEEGLERVKLKDENARLQKLTRLQNKKLKDINSHLEQTVVKRTKQIKLALQRIEKHNLAIEQVLFNVISINPDIDGKFAIEVSELATLLAKRSGLPPEEIKLVRYACLIGELGCLGLKPADYATPFSKMNYEQQKNFLTQTRQAATILAPAQHMQPISDILEFQFEHYNGSGLYNKVAKEIPVGARILAISRDYWRCVTGRLTEKHMTPNEAKQELKKHRNTRYDATFLDVLLESPEIGMPKHIDNMLSANDLEPGMVLAANLYNDSHILILPEGHVFTDSTIAKMRSYEEDHGKHFEITVKPQQPESLPEETESSEAEEETL
ncbi:response regulator [Alteromonas confluentis]|uniref:Response regulator n=1 Tax=Alteromonas confluentis TaxID=1656094 RepID=A0A1E7Z979_9ALTE|nr:response regulator [Alteromonas confluentis]OFC70012.1 response regulator [Alteromonas confluentis]